MPSEKPRDFYYFVSVARMKPGLAVERVNARLAVLAGQLATEHPAGAGWRGRSVAAGIPRVPSGPGDGAEGRGRRGSTVRELGPAV